MAKRKTLLQKARHEVDSYRPDLGSIGIDERYHYLITRWMEQVWFKGYRAAQRAAKKRGSK